MGKWAKENLLNIYEKQRKKIKEKKKQDHKIYDIQDDTQYIVYNT